MSSNVKPVKARAYCFTINNWNDTDASQLQALWDSGKVKYFVAGKETGEEGTPHIQGYVMFKNTAAFSTVKGFLSRAHIEVAKGSPEQNIEYCTKEGHFIEEGSRPMTAAKKGERGREYWEQQLKLAQENRIEECDAKLQLTHWKSLVAVRDYYLKDIGNEYRPGIKNYWLYGPTGSGKSRAVRETFSDIYYKMANKWWENYGMQEVVLIEDLDKTHHVLGHHLKLWADNYPFRGEIKNHSVMARPKHIVVTSNYHPKEIWEDSGMLEPILRRFQVVHFPLPLAGMKFRHVVDGETEDTSNDIIWGGPGGPPPGGRRTSGNLKAEGLIDEGEARFEEAVGRSPPASLPVAGDELEFFHCKNCGSALRGNAESWEVCPLCEERAQRSDRAKANREKNIRNKRRKPMN
jgi:hypothetical protein